MSTERPRKRVPPRRKPAEAAPEPSGWDRAATFVVSFEQRRRDDRWERQLVVEQTELEPEQPPSVWPDWDCRNICDWMSKRLRGPVESPRPVEPTEPAPLPRLESRRSGRPRLRIEQAAITDATGRTEIVSEGKVAPMTTAFRMPGSLTLSVAGGEPHQEVLVAVRLRLPREPGWNLHDPVPVQPGQIAELVLSGVAPGEYAATLVAWTAEGSAEPSIVRLPQFTIEHR